MDHAIGIDWGISPSGCPSESDLRDWISRVLDKHCRTSASLDLRVVDLDEAQALNRDYRQKDRPTNVLSFPAEIHPAVGLNHLGDLVVCAQVVRREALEQGKPEHHHWAHLVTHGTLHLLGFDHIEEPDAEAMEREERQLLADIGIPDPYR